MSGALAFISCSNIPGANRHTEGKASVETGSQAQATPNEKPQIYFIELGSVNCIPCRQMQPVMKSIEAKYSPRVKVVFYDVWTKEQSKYAQLFNIRVIPTQVFLDASGIEIFRHQGFFPQKDLEKFLADQGVKPATKESSKLQTPSSKQIPNSKKQKSNE